MDGVGTRRRGDAEQTMEKALEDPVPRGTSAVESRFLCATEPPRETPLHSSDAS